MYKRLLLITSLLPLLPMLAQAEDLPSIEINGLRDSEWASYRHAYKTTAFFATFTRSRPLIQAQMQIRPLTPEASLEGLKLVLAGEKTRLDIAVDAIGRATIPLSKEAYEEDAVLRLNRQKGQYYFSGRYSIREHGDGVYTLDELRAACEQLIDAQRASGYRMRLIGKRCAGVKFSYPAGAEAAPLEVRTADGALLPVTLTDGHPFEDNSMGTYRIALLRFADLPPQAKVMTLAPPLAIGTAYE